MKKILILITLLLGLTFADTLQKDYAYVISAIGIKNVEGNVVWQSGSSNQLADGTYKLAPQVIVYDGVTQYVGAATPFTGCLNGKYYNSAGAPDGACFAGGIATSSQNGLMSAADKAKLDGINLSNYALAGHTHDDRYVTLSGNQTISAQKTFSNLSRSAGTNMTIASGLPKMNGSQVTGSIWAANGISFSNPGTQNDAGWIRVTGSGESDTLLEIATGDDGANDFNITFRAYDTSNNVVYDVRVPKRTGTLATLDMIYPVGSIYTTASGAYPGDLFGGGWTKIGTQLAISGNVVGNGYALGLTDNNSYGGLVLHHNPSRTAISPKAFGAGQGSWSDDIASLDRRAFGVPTKAQLGSNLYKSGLVVDAINVNVWQRTS